MPIIEKNVEWSETDDSLSVRIVLRGVNKKNASILSSSRYLKLSYPPYLWEAFLKDFINPKNTITRIGDGTVIFWLTKQKKQMWNELFDPKAVDKCYCQEMRKLALSEIEAEAEEDNKQREIKKSERDRAAVQLQISLESDERKRIETIKENERQNMAAEIEKWQLAVDSNKSIENEESLRSKHTEDRKHSKIEMLKKQHEKCGEKVNVSKPLAINRTEETLESLPLPRTSGHITVSFSPREFPTAARESQKQEEDEWLKKQAQSRKFIDLESSDLRPEEKNPMWLKDKGDEFYSKGDFVAAINAYNLAIKMCPKLPSLYSNRAACYLKCRNLHKAIEDTSEALSLLTPPVEANAAARLKCHIRRGTAFCQLELYFEGLQDYEAALKIDPQNNKVKEDAIKIRKVIESATE